MSTSCWVIGRHSASLYCNFISLVPTVLATIFCMILVRLFLFIHFSQAIRAELFSRSYISGSVWNFQLAWSIFLPVVGNNEGLLYSTFLLFFFPWGIKTNQNYICSRFFFFFFLLPGTFCQTRSLSKQTIDYVVHSSVLTLAITELNFTVIEKKYICTYLLTLACPPHAYSVFSQLTISDTQFSLALEIAPLPYNVDFVQ